MPVMIKKSNKRCYIIDIFTSIQKQLNVGTQVRSILGLIDMCVYLGMDQRVRFAGYQETIIFINFSSMVFWFALIVFLLILRLVSLSFLPPVPTLPTGECISIHLLL